MVHNLLMVLAAALLVTIGAGAQTANAATREYLDYQVQSSLAKFKTDVAGAGTLLDQAAGVLVFPRVLKAGLGWGGEFGEGALLLKGQVIPASYYNIISLSFGFQMGIQSKTVIFAFLTDKALTDFQNSAGWKVGIDGSVTVIAVGIGTSIDTSQALSPIVAFITDQKGLMYNLTLEGTKISRITK